jgi:hypothetical protein
MDEYETIGDIPDVVIKEVVLKDLDTAISAMIPNALPGHMIESVIRHVAGAMIVELHNHIWSEDLKHFHFTFPKTWWQHLRKALGSTKYKVKTIDIDIKAIYPELRLQLPKDKHILKVMVKEGDGIGDSGD